MPPSTPGPSSPGTPRRAARPAPMPRNSSSWRLRSSSAATSVPTAVRALGSGLKVTAPDTVPFALWSAARRLNDYEDALWETAVGLGDVDTTCAIVGGIVGASVGREGIPPEWLASREALPPLP